jgi:hypothetical protein
MTLETMRAGYERIHRRRFPSVVVVADPTDRSPDWPPYLHIHCLPRPRLAEWLEYSIYELPKLLEAAGLPDALIFPHSEAQTREHHPGVCPHRRRRIVRPGRRAGRRAGPRTG